LLRTLLWDGREVGFFCTFLFTGPVSQPFRPLSPCLHYRKTPKDCNNYFRLSVRETVSVGARREARLRRTAGLRFVCAGKPRRHNYSVENPREEVRPEGRYSTSLTDN
jgi:hypothetical protein